MFIYLRNTKNWRCLLQNLSWRFALPTPTTRTSLKWNYPECTSGMTLYLTWCVLNWGWISSLCHVSANCPTPLWERTRTWADWPTSRNWSCCWRTRQPVLLHAATEALPLVQTWPTNRFCTECVTKLLYDMRVVMWRGRAIWLLNVQLLISIFPLWLISPPLPPHPPKSVRMHPRIDWLKRGLFSLVGTFTFC